jgi:hypothetical protein
MASEIETGMAAGRDAIDLVRGLLAGDAEATRRILDETPDLVALSSNLAAMVVYAVRSTSEAAREHFFAGMLRRMQNVALDVEAERQQRSAPSP